MWKKCTCFINYSFNRRKNNRWLAMDSMNDRYFFVTFKWIFMTFEIFPSYLIWITVKKEKKTKYSWNENILSGTDDVGKLNVFNIYSHGVAAHNQCLERFNEQRVVLQNKSWIFMEKSKKVNEFRFKNSQIQIIWWPNELWLFRKITMGINRVQIDT